MSDLTDREIARFWSKVERRGPDDCWPWTSGRFKGSGYGAFWLRRNNVGSHRIACAFEHGDGYDLFALHSCDNRICCNPRHLRWGTPADNMADRSDRGRAPIGERHGNSTLTAADVLAIRFRRTRGETLRSIAGDYGITLQAVAQIAAHKTWRHV